MTLLQSWEFFLSISGRWKGNIGVGKGRSCIVEIAEKERDTIANLIS